MKEVIIIGAGPAGISAGIYAARSGMKVTIFEGNMVGGQTVNISRIENYPGIEKIEGADFAMNLYSQALSNEIEFIQEEVTKVDFSSDWVKKVYTSQGEYGAEYIIIANGAKRRKLGCKGEKEFGGKGVSYCAVCDGNFFKGQDVCVIGGGNSAAENASYLSEVCHKVYVIVRKSKDESEKNLPNFKDNVEVIYEAEVEEINGKDSVESIKIKSKKGVEAIEAKGVFIAIGYISSNEIYKSYLKQSDDGYIITDENCRTSMRNVYAIGDTRKKPVKQIITAEADGAIASTTIVKGTR